MRRGELVRYLRAREYYEAIAESSGVATKEVPTVMTETRYEHIMLTEDSVPMIAGTKMKVVELVLDHIAYGWSPEELHFQHQDLTMGQIHSALAYYWDHQEELDQNIEEGLEFIEEVKRNNKPTRLASKLKAKERG